MEKKTFVEILPGELFCFIQTSELIGSKFLKAPLIKINNYLTLSFPPNESPKEITINMILDDLECIVFPFDLSSRVTNYINDMAEIMKNAEQFKRT